jgi:hypothetical protein
MLATLALLAVFGSAARAQGQAEGGDYIISGTQLDGDTYAGGLEILQYSEEEYFTLSWQLAEPAYGQGILNGSVLSAVWGEGCELLAYTYDEADGSLTGQWVDTATGSLNPENAEVVEIGETSGTWSIAGETSDGGTYEGTMTIIPSDDQQSAEVIQQIGDSEFTGIALEDENVFTVAMGEDCGVANYILEDNGDLTGRWTLTGETAVGTENATPTVIDGSHSLTGTNPDGSTYTGTLDVTADNQVHTFAYDIDGITEGVGILRGNTVAVGFGGDQCSVTSYFVYPDGSLAGLWALVGDTSTGTENAFRTDEIAFSDGALIPDIQGEYEISGTDLEGNTYSGTLTITPQGDVYQLTWTFDDGTAEGVGVLLGNTLMVGFGGEGCAVNAYSVSPDAMDGLWAVYGRDSLGTETATR